MLRDRIAYIREQLGDIKTLISEKNRLEILSDKLLIKGLKYSLQTAIEDSELASLDDSVEALGSDLFVFQTAV